LPPRNNFPPPQRGTASRLGEAGIANPGLEARLLAAHADGDPQRLEALLTRRLAHEPMAFILGRQGFWTLDLEVSPATLIPRADTETLIEAALAALPDRAAVRRVLDLGTGTGCLLLAALVEFPAAWGVGLDVSAAAAALAGRNARVAGLADRALFLCADWTAPIAGRFDLVLCNPPYVATPDIAALMPEVAGHEPLSALDGGRDGLDAYRSLIPTLPTLLRRDGVAVLELGQGQDAAVAEQARHADLAVTALRHDLGGVARALVLRRRRCCYTLRDNTGGHSS
jgi:release factor glutamine methyltransferase